MQGGLVKKVKQWLDSAFWSVMLVVGFVAIAILAVVMLFGPFLSKIVFVLP